MSFTNIAVLGLGKVGLLAAKLLHESGFNVTGYDLNPPREDPPFPVKHMDLANPDALDIAFGQVEAVLSCLPYHLNVGIATAAHKAGIHYFDLTEDVPTTKAIIELSKNAKGLMAPQCGLAPGFIGIVGADHSAHAGRGLAAKPDRPFGLCLQLVAGRRGQ